MGRKRKRRQSQNGWHRFKRAVLEILDDLELIARRVLFLLLTLAALLLVANLVLFPEIAKAMGFIH